MDIDEWRIIIQRRQDIKGSTLQPCDTVEQLRVTALESFVDRGSEAAAFYREFSPIFLRNIYESGRHDLSLTYLRLLPDGSKRWVCSDMRFLTNPDTGHLCVMLTVRDIEAQKQGERELILAAETDGLTGLLNRAAATKYIGEELKKQDCHHALFMIDVDNFKSLNDTLGHQTGDEFLQALAGALRSCFRESDIVGRVGGDEFFVLMKKVPNRAIVKEKAEALLAGAGAVCARYPSVTLSVSIGIGLYPEDGRTLETLYASSDEALYQAKGMGKGRFVFASES